MPGAKPSLIRQWLTGAEKRDTYPLSMADWVSQFTYNGLSYPISLNTSFPPDRETPPNNFVGYANQFYGSNGVVFACMLSRLSVFSEARFQFQRMPSGRPGDLFGTRELDMLDRPWTNGTTGDLLSKIIQHADLAGNAYVVRRPTQLKVLRPDWVTIALGTNLSAEEIERRGTAELDAEVLGYLYKPGGPASGVKPVALTPQEVAHFAPNPDPTASFRGMSWLTPVINEIMGDSAANRHKIRFYENGATPNLVVSLDPTIRKEAFDAWVKAFEDKHQGAENAYKTLYLGAGADAKVIGADFRQIDFKTVQGAGETRIAAAAGVPPVIVGLSEGLQAATYSNYAQARRRFVDGTIRPLWRNAAGSLASIINVPGGSRLWYDDRDIPFLREDKRDEAEIHQVQAATIRTLVEAGFTPDSVVAAVMAGDYKGLEHTDLFSVQLQPPQPNGPEPEQEPAATAGRALAALLKPYLNGRTPDAVAPRNR